jgi:hypothetical protein
LTEDPARSAMLAALAGGRVLPAAITNVFIARDRLSDAPGRSLHVAERFDDKIDEWLAT